MQWIYNLPSWQFLLLCIVAFSAFSVLGASVFRTAFERRLGLSDMLSKVPERSEMRRTVRSYAEYLVGEGWALQRKGIVPKGTSQIIDRLDAQLAAYPLESQKDSIIFEQIMERNNSLGELRRQRVNFVQAGLPSAIWEVLLIGDLVIVMLTWLLVIKNRGLDMLINVLCGTLLGALIFVIAVMDRPFQGEFGVTPAPFQLLLDGIMKHATP